MLPLLFGDVDLDEWPPAGEVSAEPWKSFERARELLRSGDQGAAGREWQRIASLHGIESRHTLQAWHFLREVGTQPPDDVAPRVLGVVAEVAVSGGHDVLAAYRDGSVRYLNYTGKVLVVEADVAPAELAHAVDAWLRIAETLAQVVGVWDQPKLPPLPAGDTRITMLTPGGLRFGQGPDRALRADAGTAAYLAAATLVLTSATALAT